MHMAAVWRPTDAITTGKMAVGTATVVRVARRRRYSGRSVAISIIPIVLRRAQQVLRRCVLDSRDMDAISTGTAMARDASKRAVLICAFGRLPTNVQPTAIF
jgi:hypothetical protein